MNTEMGRLTIKRALLSVSNKTGIEQLALALKSFGCEIISTGGTRQVLEQIGMEITDVGSVTGNPEAFGGRMKTISFPLESALLYDRTRNAEEARRLGIAPIDMVVCNFYPFAEVRNDANLDTLVEHIDIGGPTMVRAGAKNSRFVAVLTDPADYPKIIQELRDHGGKLSLETRERLMRKAFSVVADYDAMIAVTLGRLAGEETVRLSFTEGRELRYGENTHQSAVFLRQSPREASLHDLELLHGKALSFNNLVDMQAATEAVRDLSSTGCAIIKHTNPCGLSQGGSQREVFEHAWAGDPISAFGSVIAFNRTVRRDTVEFLQLNHPRKRERKFVEVVIAPGFEPEAEEYLALHKNLRVVVFDPKIMVPQRDYKFLLGSLLVQDTDQKVWEKREIVTEAKGEVDEELLEFGIIVVRQLKSNAIAVVRRLPEGALQLLGMGCGQPNRLVAVELAMKKCLENLRREYHGPEGGLKGFITGEMGRAVLVSDAFLPFPDNVDACADLGIRTIVQPGGSIRDKAVIARCNEKGVAMILTGIRHFRH